MIPTFHELNLIDLHHKLMMVPYPVFFFFKLGTK